ncbi:MAG: hypothetical protein GC181_03845 [Bacteroidetes bacterium]|nr:hypothetical protein [Bacteroidota bacterium]
MKYLFPLIAIFLFAGKVSAKHEIDSVYLDSLKNIEFQLEGLSFNIINGQDQAERVTSCYYFIQKLKKALMVPGSFDYEFPLLKQVRTVSIMKPDDNKFRLFTWNLLLDSDRYMYFGAIQMHNEDSLVLYGLYDSAKYLHDIQFETYDNRHWIGALYYQIHSYKNKRKKYYLLFGWDGEDEFTNKKVIDVLWFDENDRPQFGAPIFIVGDEIQNRLVFEFAEQAVMLVRYDENERAIVYANMVPSNPNLTGKYEYYLPDGTYNFLRYEKGFWIKYDDLFMDRKRHAYELKKR